MIPTQNLVSWSFSAAVCYSRVLLDSSSSVWSLVLKKRYYYVWGNEPEGTLPYCFMVSVGLFFLECVIPVSCALFALRRATMTRRMAGRCMYTYSVVVYVARVVYARHSYLGSLKDAKAALVRLVRHAKRDRSLGYIHGVVKAVMKRGELIRDPG